MSGKHPRSNLPFNSAAVPQFRWQLTDGGSSPAPSSAAAAIRMPRGSAAAAKRLSSRSTGVVALPSRPGFDPDTLQRAWLQPDFLQRHTPDAATVAATRAAAARLLEAATEPAPPPKRPCVLANAEAPALMDQDFAAHRPAPVSTADEPCAKSARTSADHPIGDAQPSTTPSCTAVCSAPLPTPPLLTKKSLRPVPCDAPLAKIPRRNGRADAADSCLRSAAASSASFSTCDLVTTGAVATATTFTPEVSASASSASRPFDSSKLGLLSKSSLPLPVTCTARCKTITTRDDLLRQLSSPAASKTGSSCTVSRSCLPAKSSLPVQPALKRPVPRVFPPEDPFPAKRKRASNSADLGEFASFFQKK